MSRLRAGIVISLARPAEFADLAVAAEAAGWDGIFTWEAVWGQDAWVTLTAAAMRTSRTRLGTMLTPLPRIRPWDLAGRVATLDHLSGGRVQLAVGLGALHPGWTAFEADEGRQVPAGKLDEGLAVYDGLMRGQPFSYAGEHYRVSPPTSSRHRRRCSSHGYPSRWWAHTRRGSRRAGRPGGTD